MLPGSGTREVPLTFEICVFDGDGIGPEIIAPALEVLDASVARAGAPGLRYAPQPAGAGHYLRAGEALPEASVAAARQADAILLSTMGLPAVRQPDGTEVIPQIELRARLGLFAGVRPVRAFPGQPTPLSDPRAAEMDFVLVRESTEGLAGGAGAVGDTEATETLRITRETSAKLFDFAFALARRRAEARDRPARVTCVDKADVLPGFRFFRDIFEERAGDYPEVMADAAHADAAAMRLVLRPWEFDVLVTENLIGDILSDLGAGLLGSPGLAPSADMGAGVAMFRPCHGSAPDIAGQGIANPLAMILSGAMMLDWLGAERGVTELRDAGLAIEDAVGAVLRRGEALTADLGGAASTVECAGAVRAALEA